MQFHERLKELRIERGLTQKKLGEVLNYGSSAIANYESGRNQPSIPDLLKIGEYFHITMDYLLGASDSPNPTHVPLTSSELELVGTILAKHFFDQENALMAIFQRILRNITHENINLSK